MASSGFARWAELRPAKTLLGCFAVSMLLLLSEVSKSTLMLRNAVFSIALLLILEGAAQAQFKRAAEGDKLDAVVAIVGKHPIYKSAIDAQAQLFLIQRGITNAPEDSLMALRRRILEAEIDQKVLLAKADQDSIMVTEADIDERLDQQLRMYVNQLGSEAEVERQFGRSLAELRASPELRDRARESMLVERVRYANMTTQTPSRAEVEEFFRLYRDSLPVVGAQAEIASIVKLVKPQKDQRERSYALAQALVDSARRGADFSDLARRYSQDATAARGGDFGDYFPRGTFVPVFEEAAFKLKPGEISAVVETERGFHIIKMIDRRGEEVRLAQILIKPTASAIDEEVVKNELLRIRERVLAGEDFSTLAQQLSDDEESKAQGGYLGRVRVDDLSPEQREIVDSLKIGDVSRPIRIAYPNGPSGYQIVKLLRRLPPHAVSLEEDYRELEATATQWKSAQEFQKVIQRARQSVYIEIRDLAQYYR